MVVPIEFSLYRNMGHVSFRGAVALFGDFARLERALMYYAFEKLTQHVGN
jgi:seryl-tRNA synthetase